MKCRQRYCSKDTVPPYKSCPDCRAKVREYSQRPDAKEARLRWQREEQAELYAQGICRACRVNSTHYESTRCKDCLDANAADRRKRRQQRAEAVNSGKACSQCTAHPPVRGYKACRGCLDRQRSWNRSWRAKRPDGLKRVLEALFDAPLSLEQLAEAAGMSARNTLRNLQRLEKEGRVKRITEDVEWSERAIYVLREVTV